MNIYSMINRRRTDQSRRADARQSMNAAGGYTFTVDEFARLHRFLTLGTEGGTYYTNAAELTRANAEVVFRLAASDPLDLVRHIVVVSEAGRAPKQNPALFALAIVASVADDEGRRAALAVLPRVARTGTQLFLFAGYAEQFRGWGRGLRGAVGRWYDQKPVDKLAYQVLKYRQREGWTHRDLLRLAHPTAADPAKAELYDWICGRRRAPTDAELGRSALPGLVQAFEEAQSASTVQGWVALIEANPALSWEMLPTPALGEREVWVALIAAGLPQTALLRQLPRLTRLGVLTGDTGQLVAAQLQDAECLKVARVHPINVLVAQHTYASGRSTLGASCWSPVPQISDALDAAFYHAYGAVEPANKRTLLALDISGSMAMKISGLALSCRQASAALAMVAAATEPDHRIVGFTAGAGGWSSTAVTELDISSRRRLDDVCRYVGALPMGATDCAAPMVWALENGVKVDTFQIYTDNETWYGSIHPHQALREYREKTGIPARLVVLAMTGTGDSIADPLDPGQLDVSGFDSAVPTLLADFSRGDV